MTFSRGVVGKFSTHALPFHEEYFQIERYNVKSLTAQNSWPFVVQGSVLPHFKALTRTW